MKPVTAADGMGAYKNPRVEPISCGLIIECRPAMVWDSV